MTRPVKIAIIALVAVFALLFVALLIPHDSPGLGRALLARANSDTLHIEAKGFRLHLLSGLVLEDVEVQSQLDGGMSVAATAGKVVFEHRLMPLLGGKVSVKEIRFENPVVELSSSATPASPSTASPSTASPSTASPSTASFASSAEPAAADGAKADGKGGLEIEIDRFVIVDGTLIDRSAADGSTTEIEGLDFELRRSSASPPRAS